MLPHIGKHDVVHHGRVVLNKDVAVVQNAHVQKQGITELRLGRELLFDSLGLHDEYEVNISDSLLRCLSGSLNFFRRPTTSSFTISVIMRKYQFNIWGMKGRRVTSTPYTSMGKKMALDPSIWTGNAISLRHCKISWMSIWRLVPFY